MDNLLDCSCGARAHINKGKVFCGGGTYLCENEAKSVAAWNQDRLKDLERKVAHNRFWAGKLIEDAKQMEKLIDLHKPEPTT